MLSQLVSHITSDHTDYSIVADAIYCVCTVDPIIRLSQEETFEGS